MSGKSKASCKRETGAVQPIVDLKRCKGKADCARVCPENVFEIRRIAEADYIKPPSPDTTSGSATQSERRKIALKDTVKTC
jgi:NAD-dependent dihydropyrimidine dehydrogenase PreA subunit